MSAATACAMRQSHHLLDAASTTAINLAGSKSNLDDTIHANLAAEAGDGSGAGADQASVSLGNVNLDASRRKAKKPFSFYMSVITLCLLSLITAWDATSLAIALPVSRLH